MQARSALVILSGGQDSTTCLFWAKREFPTVHAITFDYGQRHLVEIGAARRVAKLAEVDSHEVISIPSVLKGSSPIVDSSQEVAQYESVDDLPGGVEPTFVAARNILFLTIAANRAFCLNTQWLVIGTCQADFGGYPDCRRVFMDAMAAALTQGIYGENPKFSILTPLMDLTKKKSVEFASEIPGCLEALAYTHTCYKAEVLGQSCGKCHACLLRARGFEEAGIADPLHSTE